MDCGLFGVRFLFLGYKNGAAAPVDYSSTFATAPSLFYFWTLYRAASPFIDSGVWQTVRQALSSFFHQVFILSFARR